ncbi:MAG: cysteine/glutathione ABC transporter ATP-binding protein/permease CydC [Deltaproteobacteria bacterium]|jgi:ATP-binding cassette subfamily C protein CydC|nr:cysteine/glutathione ABC transporter ATP-binding protein/permease CydC [Deltaproteobacteria bacterium]
MADTKGLLTPFLHLLRPHRPWMVLGLLLACLAGAAGMGLLGLAGWFISAAAFAGLSPLTAHLFNLWHPSVGIRIFAITRTAGRYAERVVNHDITFRILESLRTWFYLRLEPLAPARLGAYRSGDILNRIVADIDALDNLYIRVLTPGLVALVMALLVTALFWQFDPGAALALFAGMVAAGFLLPMAASRAGGAPGRELARHSAWLRIHTVEGLQGLAELLIFNAADRHLRKIEQCQDTLIQTQARMSHISGATSAGLTLLSGATVGTVLFLGAGRVEHGQLDGAILAMMAFAALAAFEVVWSLPAAFQYLSRTREAARRLTEIVQQAPAVTFPSRSTSPANHDIAFEGVTFRYDRQTPDVLTNFTLRIDQGERVAVMGATGAGKSTLVNLLVRFWDVNAGRILVGGQDIRTLSEARLRREMAVVSQQSHLFNATLRDNLRLASPDADDDRLWGALGKARLDHFVSALPQELDTWIGEAGHHLSGGEARRMAIAQAVLQNAPVWLLDEPTEGLDRVTEQQVMDTLYDLTADHTMLLITHRPVDLHRMDRIAILENGRIVEEGHHDALLANGTYYPRLGMRFRP